MEEEPRPAHLQEAINNLAAHQNSAAALSVLKSYLAQDKTLANTLFYNALSWNNVEALQALITYGADVNKKNDVYNQPALHKAASLGNITIVRLLINNHARLNICDATGDTALMRAAAKGHTPIVTLLLANGERIEAINHAGDTALHYAVRHQHLDTAKVLLEKNANSNAQNHCQEAPLHIAAKQGNHQSVALLCKYGATHALKTHHQQTARELAFANNHSSLTTLLPPLPSKPTLFSNLISYIKGRNKKPPTESTLPLLQHTNPLTRL